LVGKGEPFDYFHRGKVFGVALDASDDPWTLELKLAAMCAGQNGAGDLLADPYGAIAPQLVRDNQHLEAIGRFPLPSWLTPRPLPSDGHLVTKKQMEAYVTNEGLLEMSKQLKTFVQKRVFPGRPIMLGVDHSATGGVIAALSEELGPENLSVVVLDQHFDGLPLSLRMGPELAARLAHTGGTSAPLPDMLDGNEYCCGNFWKHLMDGGVVLPHNLLFLGVADYPEGDPVHGWERFRENYLAFEARGCNYFPLRRFEGRYLNGLKRFIEGRIRTPNVYVSLDLDVGAYCSVHAARYMDRTGIEREALLNVARVIADYGRSGKFRLVGLDVMEFNVHFLGIETGEDTKDETIPVALAFIEELLQGRGKGKTARERKPRDARKLEARKR
jgi:arginase family enzyme